jgi:hypothetical protein
VVGSQPVKVTACLRGRILHALTVTKLRTESDGIR